MLAFARLLAAEELHAVIAYLKSLSDDRSLLIARRRHDHERVRTIAVAVAGCVLRSPQSLSCAPRARLFRHSKPLGCGLRALPPTRGIPGPGNNERRLCVLTGT